MIPSNYRQIRIAVMLALPFIAGLIPAARADEPEPPRIEFGKSVYPILQRACLECHGAEKQEADLRLDRRQDVLDSGMLVPGSPDESELLRRILLPRNHDERMPARGEPLGRQDILTIRRWIQQGADWPENWEVGRHWSYVAPVRPASPAVSDPTWPSTEVDRFVLQQLDRQQLRPSPPAAPETLVRRVYLDLIGLPPSPAEVERFVAAPSDAAYRQLVDDLLRRPQFGERWARPWLDLARYADSHGFQRDDFRDVWAYRDWVIQALNDDMPFDRFTIEQVAGDLLPDATESQKVASGFHRCSPTNVEAGSLPEETRVEQVIDRVNTTGAVWLGSTLECAQCHDHKYDPFTMRDYYGLLAYFNSTEAEAERTNPKVPSSIAFRGPTMRLSDPRHAIRRTELQVQLDRLRAARTERGRQLAADIESWAGNLASETHDAPQTHLLRVLAVTGNPTGKGIPADVAEAVRISADQWTAAQRQRLIDDRAERDPQTIQLGRDETRLQRELDQLAANTTLIMVELDKPRPSSIFERGDYRRSGQPVQPATPAILHPQPDGPPNRLTLARWLVDPANPLVARVTVNRWWAELFGRGLVPTVEDFGIKGDPPSHPELLDWLAVEFVESGWSMKHVLRTMVLSSTYRQSSRTTAELLERDDANRLLARGPRMRLDAEMIRDNALSISGLLSLKQFGPPIRPYQPDGIWTKVGGKAYEYQVSPGEDRYRRGIYVVLKRGAPYPSFVNFDASARLACTVKRSRTNTPLQALTLLNDPVYVEAALALATRVVTERPTADLDDQLDYAFQLCTARRPTGFERDTLRQLLRQQQQASAMDPAATDKLLGSLNVPPGVTRPTLAAWYAVATTLLNLHETITKQ